MVLVGVGVRLLDRLGAPRILDLIASLGANSTTFHACWWTQFMRTVGEWVVGG